MFVSAVLGFFHIVAIGTFGLTPLEALFPGVVIALFYHAVWKGLPLRIPTRFNVMAMVAVLASVLASTLYVAFQGDYEMLSQSLKTSLHFVYQWVFAFGMLLIPIGATQWVKALRVHFVVSFLVMLFALYQLPARALDLPLAWIDITNASFQRGQDGIDEVSQLALKFKDFYRATSIFPEPSALAGYGAASLAMLIVPIFRGAPGVIKQRWFHLLSIYATIVAVFLAFSMTAVILVSATVALIVILYPKGSIKRLALVAGVGLVMVVGVDRVVENSYNVSVLELFAKRLTSLVSGAAVADETGAVYGESVTQRVSDYQVAVEAFEDSPILGVGPGNFSLSKAGKYHNQEFPASVWGSVLSELGIIGFICLVVFMFGTYFSLQADERRWTRGHLGEDSDEERLSAILPFRWLLIILAAFTSNFFVSSILWFDVVFLFSAQSAVRRAMGMDDSREFFLVQRSWQSRLAKSRQYMEHNGISH